MFKQNGKVNIYGERMIWFRKLILDSVCKININYVIARSNALISFKINVQRRGSVKMQNLKQFTLVPEINDDLNSNKEIEDDLETSYYGSSESKTNSQKLGGIKEEEELDSPRTFLERLRNRESTKKLNNLVQQLLSNRNQENIHERRRPGILLSEENVAVNKEPILT